MLDSCIELTHQSGEAVCVCTYVSCGADSRGLLLLRDASGPRDRDETDKNRGNVRRKDDSQIDRSESGTIENQMNHKFVCLSGDSVCFFILKFGSWTRSFHLFLARSC